MKKQLKINSWIAILPEVRLMETAATIENYISIIFPIAFSLIWISTCFLLPRFGWKRFSAEFGVSQKPKGTTYRMRSGAFGTVGYNSCLTFIITEKGLYTSVLFFFRIGHKPFLVPWSAYSKMEMQTIHSKEYLRVEFQYDGGTFAAFLPESAKNHLNEIASKDKALNL